MELTEEQKQTVLQWLDDKCEGMRCTCCGYQQWLVQDFATVSIGIDLSSTRFHYGQGMLQVNVVCGYCGHILHFNPATMGIEPEPPEEKDIPGADSLATEQHAEEVADD